MRRASVLVSIALLTGCPPAFAESHLSQHKVSSGGGRAGSGNPMQAMTIIGQPFGGMASGANVTVHGGGPGGPADTTPPVISGVAVSAVGAATATITWTTDEPATSQAEYGLTTGYGSLTAHDTTLVTAHAVGLTGLTASTLYHYRVRSSDAAGNTAVSADGTFTTTAPDTTPPTGSVTINGGTGFTNDPIVTLTLSANDDSGEVAQMRCSDNGTTYTPAEPYVPTAPWTFAAGDGPKTLHVKYSDPSGNWSQPASDTIELDTVPPPLTITSPSDGANLGP